MSFNQWRCALLPRPVFWGLQTLRRDVLAGATQRDAVSVAVRAAAHLYRQPGGPELLRAFHEELMRTASSEMTPLFMITEETTAPPEAPRQERVVFQAGR